MIKVKKLTELDIPPPAQAKPGDAGYDLRSADRLAIPGGEYRLIETGYAWEIPKGFFGKIEGRSGFAIRYGISVLGGVVDSSYRGEVCVILHNTSRDTVYIDRGERIAQMIIQPCLHSPISVVDELGESDRGNNGFGSTGRD